MKRVRSSVSDINALRWYRKMENMELEELRRQILRQSEPNDAMRMGSAVHKYLETVPNELVLEGADISGGVSDGYVIEFDTVEPVMLSTLREVKTEKVYEVPGFSVTMACVTDCMDAITCLDHKLTKKFDPDKYLDSVQWRFYLDMFGCDRFVYQVFVYTPKENRIRVREVHRFELYRYEGMEKDLHTAIEDYCDFVSTHIPEKVHE